MPETPDTAAVVEDIARGRACFGARHESKIVDLNGQLEQERRRHQRASQQAYAAQQGLISIATAMGLPSPVNQIDATKVDVLPILDEIAKIAGRPLDEDGAKEAPKAAPRSAAAQAGQDIGVKLGEQFLAAIKPLGEQLIADIKEAARGGKAPR